VIDGEGRMVYGNAACETLLGWDRDQMWGTSAFEIVHPDDRELALVSLLSMSEHERGTPLELRIATAGGGWRLLELVAVNKLDDPTVAGIVIVARDISERRRWELVGGDPSDRFRGIVQGSASIMMLVDGEGTIRSVSAALTRLLGHDPGAVEGSQLLDWIHPPDVESARAMLLRAARSPGTTTFEARFRHRERAAPVPLEVAAVNLLDDPVVQGLVVSAHDISALRTAQEALQHLATHDVLTELPNRVLLDDRLRVAIGRAARETTKTVVLFIDLDRFKPVNDLLGHDAGDDLLRQLARRLRSVTRPGDTVARYGGDEFVVVAEGLPSEHEADELARRVEEAVAQPFEVAGTTTQVYASVGMVLIDDERQTTEGVLAEADAALYAVKAARRGGDPRSALRVTERRALAEELRAAIRDGEMEVWYQPIVAIRRGNLVGFEALVRWRHPARGLLLPGEFLDVAEDAGLDVTLGALVLDAACRQLQVWSGSTSIPLTMSVNISAAQLASPDLPDIVRSIVGATGASAPQLCLEITERAMLERAARGTSTPAAASLDRLKGSGVRIAIDDFGTGYSSLTHVRHFPVDVLKIDRTFVSGIGGDKGDTSIVAAVVGLAHAMDMVAVAEGVETDAQLSALRALGCDQAQGFLLGRPMPAADASLALTAV
jgi:diguanylate cyclase (GGDEF)-like protein/PAS domain S-box-containing protein